MKISSDRDAGNERSDRRTQPNRFYTLLCLLGLLATIGCRDADSEFDEREAMEHDSTPSTGMIVRLSAVVQEQIGLDVTTVQTQAVSESIESTGWLRAIPGTESAVRAPATGFYLPNSDAPMLAVGQAVRDDEELGQLQAFVTPLDAVQLVLAKEEADILIGQSSASLAIAEEQLRNLTVNDATQAVAGTRMQQLRETAEQARVAIREAKEKLQFLPAEPYEKPFDLEPIRIASHQAGTIIEVHVAPRQFVVQGDPIYTVANWDSLWLEVPMFETDDQRVLTDKAAQVTLPGVETPLSAPPVTVPSTTPPGGRTVNRYFTIENPDVGLRPGRPLAVSLPTKDLSEAILVPRSALVWDGFGNAWVYVRINPTTFQRTRVEIGSNFGDAIEIRRGLKERAEVVTTGTQTLFGEEFRDQLQTEDDD